MTGIMPVISSRNPKSGILSREVLPKISNLSKKTEDR